MSVNDRKEKTIEIAKEKTFEGQETQEGETQKLFVRDRLIPRMIKSNYRINTFLPTKNFDSFRSSHNPKHSFGGIQRILGTISPFLHTPSATA